jgi:predicted O-methyltransferase YrrM
LKSPLSRYFNAFRYAAVGRRFEGVRKLWSALANSRPSAAGESLDIGALRSFEEFEAKYATLATFFGRTGKTPPPAELDFLHAMVDL